MIDIAMVVTTLVFFVACLGYVAGCEREMTHKDRKSVV